MTTPRPWVAQSSDDGKSDPWWIDTHAYEDGPQPVWAPPQYPVSEADVALIVEAVNAHDRLQRLEAAAREAEAAFSAKPDTDEANHPEGLTHDQVATAWTLWEIRQAKALGALRDALQLPDAKP